MTTTHTQYKGFNIEFFIARTGFNQYKILITKYRNKGTRREEYFMHHIETYSSSKKKASKIAKEYINGIDESQIEWSSQGLSKATYLPE